MSDSALSTPDSALLISRGMAIISEFEEDQKPEAQQKLSSSAPPLCGDADDDALYPVLERQGPLAFLEAAIDLVRRKSDFFKDEAAVTKVTEVVSAAKAKADADERAREQAKREVKKAAPSSPSNDEAPVKMEVDAPSEQPKVEDGKADANEKDGRMSPNAVEFIINHAEVSIAFSQENKIQSMLVSLPKCAKHLKSMPKEILYSTNATSGLGC